MPQDDMCGPQCLDATIFALEREDILDTLFQWGCPAFTI